MAVVCGDGTEWIAKCVVATLPIGVLRHSVKARRCRPYNIAHFFVTSFSLFCFTIYLAHFMGNNYIYLSPI